MAYKVDKPEVNSDTKRLEQWANMTSDDLMFALNDLDRQINNTTPQYLVNDKTTIEIDSAVIEDSKHAVSGGAVYTALETKVDKETGKGLSTNDYTDSEKTKLSNIEAGAEVNVQSDWNESDNTSDDYIKNKPTKVSDFTNDSGFITNTVNNLVNYYLKSETYTKTEVDNIATAIKNSRFEFVNSLPTTDIKTNVIYLVPKNPTQTNNYKDEYINRDGTTSGWEKIGDTEIDLSNYVTTTALNTALQSYVLSSSLGTAAYKNVPSSGNASTTQVVMGNDTRLTDARTPTSHTHDDRYYTKTETDTKLATKQDKTFLTCSTARNVKDKVVDYTGFTLTTGAEIVVKFTDTTTTNPASGNLTLNVNGTGAIEIKNHYNTIMNYGSAGWFCNNRHCYFVYDGTNWVFMNQDNNTTYSNISTDELLTGTATSQRTVRADYTYTALDAVSTSYGTCNTAADVAAKEVTISNNKWKLRAGARIMVKYSYTNTATNCTINVNGTGAKQVWYNTAVLTNATNWIFGYANAYICYIYDGTYWVWQNICRMDNTTYTAMSASELTTGTATNLRTVRADYLKQGIESLITSHALNVSVSNETLIIGE